MDLRPKASTRVSVRSDGRLYRMWTDEEKEWLRKFGPKLTKHHISILLSRSVNSVTRCMLSLGIVWKADPKTTKFNRKSTPQLWQGYPETYLREHAGKVHVSEIAKHLRRSETSVRSHAKKLHICVRATGRFWSDEENDLLHRRGEKETVARLAVMLGRTEDAVLGHLTKLGLKPLGQVISIGKAMKRSGYGRCQLMRAKEALGQQWKRLDHNRSVRKNGDVRAGTFSITEEQFKACCDWLRDNMRGRLALPKRNLIPSAQEQAQAP